MKRKIFIALLLSSILFIMSCGSQAAPQYTKEELNELIVECQQVKENAATMAASARQLGWTDESELIQELKSKWHTADSQEIYYKEQLELLLVKEARWEEKKREFPNAVHVWEVLQEQGYNDYVCAGIIGNMMAEAGGQTLNIQSDLYSSTGTFYGICQWHISYYSSIRGSSLDEQLQFLLSNIKEEFDTFGFLYQKNFNFDKFLELEDAAATAKAFAQVYERCASSTYNIREKHAITAYTYFTN